MKPSRISRLLIFTFLCASLYGILKPWAPEPKPVSPEAKAFLPQIITLDGKQQIASLLNRDDGKPAMLMIYASWCPYCRRMMPDVQYFIAHNEFAPAEPIFISVDESIDSMAEYLVHSPYGKLFKPYVAGGGSGELMDILHPMGSRFDGSIPYVGFFQHGKLVAEFKGYGSKEQLLTLAALMRKSISQ